MLTKRCKVFEQGWRILSGFYFVPISFYTPFSDLLLDKKAPRKEGSSPSPEMWKSPDQKVRSGGGGDGIFTQGSHFRDRSFTMAGIGWKFEKSDFMSWPIWRRISYHDPLLLPKFSDFICCPRNLLLPPDFCSNIEYIKGINFRVHKFLRVLISTGTNFTNDFNAYFAGINFREFTISQHFEGINFRESAT